MDNCKKCLDNISYVLKSATRIGKEVDEPEGSRYIVLSDTLATTLINYIKKTLNEC